MITRQLRKIESMIAGAKWIGENMQIHGVSIDSRTVVQGNLYIPIIGPNSNGHDYIDGAIQNGAVATLWKKDQPNPPQDIPTIFVEDTLIALQQLAASYRNQLKQATFIGITGSNGKTSTKDILHQVLSTRFKTKKTIGNYNNHIGVPLTLLSLDEDVEMAVIEMGMDHLLEIAFLSDMVKPDIAMIMNIGSAHLETMGTLENIAQAKCEIVTGLKKDGVLVVNGDDDLLLKETKRHSCKQLTFGEKSSNQLYLTSFHQGESSLQFTASNSNSMFALPLIGRHQAINCLAVMQVAHLLHLSEADIQTGFRQIQLTAQRNEVKRFGSVTIINDTYKSNPESVKAAIQTLESLPNRKRKIFVMGDMVDMGEQAVALHKQIGTYIAEANIDMVLGSGDLTFHTITSIQERDTLPQADFFLEEEKLIETIIVLAKEPCTILLKASRSLQFDKVVEAIEKRLVK